MKNGKGKEYYFDSYNLKYNGEYLNNERHGKGIEYYNISDDIDEEEEEEEEEEEKKKKTQISK